MLNNLNIGTMSDSSTKTDALPKSGHVNEVCKEWLVREDGALAYKLQSQEITDYYKGNRYRNAVVRHDFPTALHEQIKERETADKQAEQYRQYLTEQEEHDKQIAKEIADKLELDLEEQRIRELEESEQIAKELQDIYVNLPPPQRRDKRHRSRPDKASIVSTANHHQNHALSHPHTQGPQSSYAQNGNSPLKSPTQYENCEIIRSVSHTSPSKSHAHASNRNGEIANTSQTHNRDFEIKSHKSNLSHDIMDSKSSASRSFPTPMQIVHNNIPNQIQSYNDVADSIRQYDITIDKNESSGSHHLQSSRNNLNQMSPINENLARADYKLQKLSPEKYDYIMGNKVVPALNISKEMQEADKIEVLDSTEIINLEEFGLPIEEIQEISKKIAQEKKDEELARKLQEMERKDGLSQEQRDRLLAIEAQDKELAKMLQEREKAKAKRAKEKARLRKIQNQKDGVNDTSAVTSSALPEPEEILSIKRNDDELTNIDLEPYSNPIDLITHQRLQSAFIADNSQVNKQLPSYNHGKEDDIYTLPVDSCRPSNRPNSLNITSDSNQFSITKESINQQPMIRSMVDTHDNVNNEISARMQHSKSSSFEKSSSPTPPYMPIQGTRRSNSTDDRKKKSKDKCTHQ